MAKITFNKLGLSKKTENVFLDWNGQKVEVIQYLPLDKKLEMISEVINDAVDLQGYYAPCRVDLFMTMAVIKYYTNITFTDKQKEDLGKLFDLMVDSGFYSALVEKIPESELNYIKINVKETIESIYKYKNSVLGILDTINADYKDTVFSAEKIQEALSSGEGLDVVRDVVSKLG